MDIVETSRRGISRRGFLRAGTFGTLGGLALLNLPRVLRGDTYPGHVIPELDPRTIRICYNENPLGPSPESVTAMGNEVAESNWYPSWTSSSLRNAVATQYGLNGDKFIFGAGASEIIHLAADVFLGPGDELIWADPSYSQMPAEAAIRGAAVVEVPLTVDYKHDLAAMAAAVTSNTKMIMITNPNNPTGTIFDPEDFETFMDDIPNEVLVVMDQAYYEYINDPAYPDFIEYISAGRRFLIIKTFSKVYGLAGARAGFGISTSAIINQLANFKIMASLGRVTEAGAVAALDSSQHIADTIALNNQAKQLLYGEFDRMGLAYIPSEANFLMVDCGTNSEPVYNQLNAQGIYVRRGWGMENWLRVSTGTMTDMVAFVNALEEILFENPAPIRDLQITRNNADMRLRWTAPGEVDWYEIYRSRQASFVPTQADSVGMTTDTTWVDPGVVSQGDYYYYRVKSKRNGR
jgi:histidinol-phosphate aminotransferase